MERAIGYVPRQDRRAFALSGLISLVSGQSIPVKVSNVSREGCQVQVAEILPIGETVTLACPPHGVVLATIRWALPGGAGLRFREE
jgi:hypothetical protein